MSDYIKREDVREAFNTADECGECPRNLDNCFGCVIAINTVCDVIDKIPSADVVERGEWIYDEHDIAMCDGYRCDKCGFFVPWDYEHKFIDFIKDYHFCPSCGADMRKE